ncbi:MAG: YbbR-like domain-containing protein [Bacteroidetes bacterium]|nr:YbbR-like domain-containing protein [Bacteroidota bacterium]
MNNSNAAYAEKKLKPGKATAFFICIGIAAMLWVLQALNTVYNYTITVPVVFKNLPQNKKPLAEIPNVLKVDIKASGLKLLLVLANKPFKTIEVDFNTLKSVNKMQNYILSSGSINFKGSFKFETQIKHISPDTLYFSEKNGYQKNVPVKVPLYIKCALGYGAGKPVITPAFVTIWGDTADINRIDTIYTQPVNLVNVNKNYNSDLVIIKPNSNISTSETKVVTSIEVAKLIEHTITLPITVINGQNFKQVNIFPSKVKVKFTAIQNAFAIADTVLFKASIDPEKTNANNKCYVYLSTVPGNVNILSIVPKEVELLIIKN